MNGVRIWGRQEHTHLTRRGTTQQGSGSGQNGVFVTKCEGVDSEGMGANFDAGTPVKLSNR